MRLEGGMNERMEERTHGESTERKRKDDRKGRKVGMGREDGRVSCFLWGLFLSVFCFLLVFGVRWPWFIRWLLACGGIHLGGFCLLLMHFDIPDILHNSNKTSEQSGVSRDFARKILKVKIKDRFQVKSE